jgi:hypothetical protein
MPAGLGVVRRVNAASGAAGQSHQPGGSDGGSRGERAHDRCQTVPCPPHSGSRRSGALDLPQAECQRYEAAQNPRFDVRNFYRFRRVTNHLSGVVIPKRVDYVGHVTCPSRWFLRTGGVSLGRCGSTGPAVFSGDRAGIWPRSSASGVFVRLAGQNRALAHSRRRRSACRKMAGPPNSIAGSRDARGLAISDR